MVLLALVQTTGLSLLNRVRDSGNMDDLMESLGSVLSTERCEMAEISLEHVIQTESLLPVKEHAVADHVRALFLSSHSQLSLWFIV